MNGKRYTTEEKRRSLRGVDGGMPVQEICRGPRIARHRVHAAFEQQFRSPPWTELFRGIARGKSAGSDLFRQCR